MIGWLIDVELKSIIITNKKDIDSLEQGNIKLNPFKWIIDIVTSFDLYNFFNKNQRGTFSSIAFCHLARVYNYI